MWWPQGSRSLLALLCPSLTLCPGQMSQDEAVALTPWKEEGPFSWQRDPPSHTLDLHIQVADVCGWSDVICSWSGRTVMAWPLRLCAGHFWGLSWVWGALSLCASVVQEALLGMGSSPGHVSGSPGLGGFPGHSWGSLLATLARSAVANSVNTGKGWIIFSLCYPAVGQGWGGTDISKLGLPSGNSFYLTNKEVLGALQPRWSWIGSCASVKFCCYKTKLN